jgi:hypothetical protein
VQVQDLIKTRKKSFRTGAVRTGLIMPDDITVRTGSYRSHHYTVFRGSRLEGVRRVPNTMELSGTPEDPINCIKSNQSTDKSLIVFLLFFLFY